jgi:hypothetical protein
VTKLGRSGALEYSTYLGGNFGDGAFAVALDPTGNVTLTGSTASADFPLKNPIQSDCGSPDGVVCLSTEAFVTRLNPTGSAIVYSTYLGGSLSADGNPEWAFEYATGLAVDPRGNAYIGGLTFTTDFPTVNALQSGPLGSADGFVAKIAANQPPDCSAATASPATIWPPNGKLVPVSIGGVTDPDGDPVALTITGVHQDEPLSRQGTPDALGIGASTAQLRADRSGGGDGRVYHVTFEASDGNGGVCTATVTVCVPRDQGRGRTCGDGGPLFPSGV